MKIYRFEDILAWQRSRELVCRIYAKFKNCHDFGFRDQIQRAGISIMNNIAEGFDRKGDREFLRYLSISKGSCAEVRSMLYATKDIGYLSSADSEELITLTLNVKHLIVCLMMSLQNPKNDSKDVKGRE